MNIPERWGLCFDSGREFCEAFLPLIESGQPVDYVEIGIAHGRTLRAVGDFLSQWPGLKWRCFGVDVPGYTGDALNPQEMGARYGGVCVRPEDAAARPIGQVSVNFSGSAEFLKRCGLSPNYVFIDGCHGKKCATADFLAVEKIIAPGGVVCFHDTNPECQGIHFQPHCGETINVRSALRELRLLNEEREGWETIGLTPGHPPTGKHGCHWFRRS